MSLTELAPLIASKQVSPVEVTQQVLDRIGEYVAAGADQVNIALRAPFALDPVERLAVTLGLS